jgi:hypothetical protein
MPRTVLVVRPSAEWPDQPPTIQLRFAELPIHSPEVLTAIAGDPDLLAVIAQAYAQAADSEG